MEQKREFFGMLDNICFQRQLLRACILHHTHRNGLRNHIMPSSPLLPSAFDALRLSDETVRIARTPRHGPPTFASANLLQDALKPEQRLAINETAISLSTELLLHI